jgi:lipopolysaccharide transport system permease protein
MAAVRLGRHRDERQQLLVRDARTRQVSDRRKKSIGVNEGFELTARPASTKQLLIDVWRSRELVFMLSRKEFFVKFRRTSGGILWSVVLPVIQASLIAAVLSKFVRFNTPVSYAVFIYAGMLAFNFMSNGTVAGVGSIVDGSGLGTKIYFPRLVFPLVVVGAGFYSLIPGLGVLIVMSVLLGESLGPELLLLVPAVALMCLFTASLAAVLSICQVYVRDSRFIVGALLQPWMYLTPVLYPLSAVGRFRRILLVNPATGIVELFRAAIGSTEPGWTSAVISTAVWTVVLAVAAIVLFRRYDRIAVDRL